MVTATLDTVREWPVEEQLEFVFRLWDQIIDAGWQPKVSPELLSELHRRLEVYEADPTQVFTWDQVVAAVRKTD